MKKSIRNIVILVCIGVGLCAGYFIVLANEDPAQSGVLYKLGGDKIKRVRIDNGYGSFVFERRDGDWIVESGGGVYRTNPEKMKLLISCLNEFAIIRMLPEEKIEYGFNEPQAKVLVTTDGGKGYGFDVGADAISGSSVYIKSGGKVMLTSTGMTSQLTGSLAAYRAKDVLTVDPSNIRSIEYYVKGEKTLELRNTDYKNWTMGFPFEAPARSVILNEYVSKLRNLIIAGYVDSGNTPEDTGLANPASSMVLTDEAGVRQRLDFGSIDGNLEYVRIGGESDIVKLYAADVDFSGLTPRGVMYVAPLDIDISRVRSVSIQAEGVNDVFTLQHANEGDGASDVAVKLNGADVSLPDFASVYFKIMTLNADGYETGGEAPVYAEREAVCAVTLTNGEKIELSLYGRDADTLYMFVNGELLTSGQTIFYTERSSLTELFYRLQNIKRK